MKKIDRLAAGWFQWMGVGGLLLSLLIFGLYSKGIIFSYVSPSDSATFWGEATKKYLDGIGLSFSPGWFADPIDGYFACSAVLAILASTALPVLVVLAASWFRNRDFLYGSMALMITAVLLIAIAR